MSPRPDVSEERRAKIIDSATRVFVRQGVANARMDDVATEAGLSKGLLYWYFKSKDEIIIAIADALFGIEFRNMQNLSVEGRTSKACLEEFLDSFLNDLHSMLKIAPVIYEFYSLAFRNATIRKVLHEYLTRFVATIEPIVQHGIDTGEFTQASARQATIAIGSALEGTMLLWAYAPDFVDLEEQLRLSMGLIINGLENRK